MPGLLKKNPYSSSSESDSSTDNEVFGSNEPYYKDGEYSAAFIQATTKSLLRSSSNLLQSAEWVSHAGSRQILAYRCCVACRLPGDVSSPAGFWEMMLNQGS